MFSCLVQIIKACSDLSLLQRITSSTVPALPPWVRLPWPLAHRLAGSLSSNIEYTKKELPHFGARPARVQLHILPLPIFVTLDNLLNLSGLQLLNHLNGMAVPVFILCTSTKAFWITPHFIVLECCVLAFSDYIILAVLWKLPLCEESVTRGCQWHNL